MTKKGAGYDGNALDWNCEAEKSVYDFAGVHTKLMMLNREFIVYEKKITQKKVSKAVSAGFTTYALNLMCESFYYVCSAAVYYLPEH